MLLSELVGNLPLVISKAIMRFIREAEDHNKDFLTVQGDLNVTLPDLNILIGLNQTVTLNECIAVDRVTQTDTQTDTQIGDAVNELVNGTPKEMETPVAVKLTNEVGVQTIKEETENSKQGESASSQKVLGVLEAVHDDDDDDDFEGIPFDFAPDSPPTPEPMATEEDSSRTPRTRRRSKLQDVSQSEGSGRRPRRQIKYTPKLQDLLSRQKDQKSRKRMLSEGQDSNTPKGKKKAAGSKENEATEAESDGEGRTFKCTECDKTFKKKATLNDHMFTHNPVSSYKCPSCDKYFLRLSKLKGHHQKAHGEPLNEETSEFLKQAVSGIKAVVEFESDPKNVEETDFCCHLCGKSFNRKASLKDHMFIHNQQSAYQCPKCLKYFLRLFRLKSHHKKMHGSELDVADIPRQADTVLNFEPAEQLKKGDHQCAVCLRTFSRLSSLKEHLFIHDREHGFKCETCGLTCVTEARLNRHITRSHGKDSLLDGVERPFRCTECPQSFKSENTLNDHLKTHAKPKSYKCSKCDEAFCNVALLQTHYQIIHLLLPVKVQDKEYACGICQKQFPNSSGLKYHLKVAHENSLRCDQCDKVFVRESQLMYHYEKVHELKRDRKDEYLASVDVTCLVCGVDFEGFSDLTEHLATHSHLGLDFSGIDGCIVDQQGDNNNETNNDNVDPPDVTFSCKICNKFSGTRTAAEAHMKAEHDDELNMMCEYCNKKFWKETSLRTHMIISHQAQRLYECKICQRKFKKPLDLTNHRREHHSGATPADLRGRVPCKQCDRTFNTPARLDDHVWVVHDKKPKPLQCPHCPKRFMRNYYLKEHMQSHSGNLKYVCEVCGKGFRRPYELTQHRHEDDLLKCELCDTTFTTLNGYRLHKRRHTDTPPLMCRFCGKTFFFKVHLANHERSHTGEKPFSCPVCNKSFRTKNLMSEHKKIHGDTRYSCSQCFRSFPLNRQLNAHMKAQHGDKPLYYCELCQRSFAKKYSHDAHMLRHAAVVTPGDPGTEDSMSTETETSEAVVYLVVDENDTIVDQGTLAVVAPHAEDHIFVPTP